MLFKERPGVILGMFTGRELVNGVGVFNCLLRARFEKFGWDTYFGGRGVVGPFAYHFTARFFRCSKGVFEDGARFVNVGCCEAFRFMADERFARGFLGRFFLAHLKAGLVGERVFTAGIVGVVGRDQGSAFNCLLARYVVFRFRFLPRREIVFRRTVLLNFARECAKVLFSVGRGEGRLFRLHGDPICGLEEGDSVGDARVITSARTLSCLIEGDRRRDSNDCFGLSRVGSCLSQPDGTGNCRDDVGAIEGLVREGVQGVVRCNGVVICGVCPPWSLCENCVRL